MRLNKKKQKAPARKKGEGRVFEEGILTNDRNSSEQANEQASETRGPIFTPECRFLFQEGTFSPCCNPCRPGWRRAK